MKGSINAPTCCVTPNQREFQWSPRNGCETHKMNARAKSVSWGAMRKWIEIDEFVIDLSMLEIESDKVSRCIKYRYTFELSDAYTWKFQIQLESGQMATFTSNTQSDNWPLVPMTSCVTQSLSEGEIKYYVKSGRSECSRRLWSAPNQSRFGSHFHA